MQELTLDDLLKKAPGTTSWDEFTGEWVIGEDQPFEPVFRMPERDVISTPRAVLDKGQTIKFRRIVVRVGYEIGVHSVTKREWYDAGVRIIAERTGQSIEVVRTVILALDNHSPFRFINNEIYQRLIRPKIAETKPENRNKRAMWFYEFTEPQRGEIIGTVIKLTGQRRSGGRSGMYGEDYDPPVLSATGRQALYKVAFVDDDIFSQHREVMVYPADILD